MNPEISVIIPVYNRARLIGDTIQSLLAQTIPPLEIIVVDDGSTDETADVAERFGAPVKVLRKRRSGPSAARNLGFAESRGQYIHFFDSDDIAVPNKHAIQYKQLTETEADIACGPWVKGRIEGKCFAAVNGVYQQRGLPRKNLIRALLTDWSIVPQACLFKRSAVEKVGGFPEDLKTLEDQLFFLKCLLSSCRVVHTPGTLTLYRDNNTDKLSEGSDRKIERCRDWVLFQMKAEAACEHFGFKPSNWFGFRARAWSVRRCVDHLGVHLEDELKLYLNCFRQDGDWAFRGYDFITRRWSSLQQRALGRRGSGSYRMGTLDSGQCKEIGKAGYEVKK